MEKQLFAGFGRADITPEEYCSLAGFGNDGDRICDFIRDRIFATCVAISDEMDRTVLLITVDLLQAKEGTTVKLGREAIAAVTGIPGNRIMISATHTHSAPSMYSMEDEPQAVYLCYLYQQLAKAAKEALADMKPAGLHFGSRQVKNMTFVRHYLMNDGTYAGANFGSFKSGIVRHLCSLLQSLRRQFQGDRSAGRESTILSSDDMDFMTGFMRNLQVPPRAPKRQL